MSSGRDPRQVAKRAIILGTISLRASLDVTDDPRLPDLSQQLMPWLHDTGCDDEVDPIERELLETPIGELSDSQQMDVNWAGEAAAFFCWMLNLAGPPEPKCIADQSTLPSVLKILKPTAIDIIQRASLRDLAQIEGLSTRYVLIRSMLQESRVSSEVKDVLRRANVQKLTNVGLIATPDAQKDASEIVTQMTPEERNQAPGIYFVRVHAALWFFSNRGSYFADD